MFEEYNKQEEKENKERYCQSVFAFLYCPCIHESGYQTVSLHRTRKAAETAMEFHREEARKEHLNLYLNEEYKKFEVEFGTTEKWAVEELKILEYDEKTN